MQIFTTNRFGIFEVVIQPLLPQKVYSQQGLFVVPNLMCIKITFASTRFGCDDVPYVRPDSKDISITESKLNEMESSNRNLIHG